MAPILRGALGVGVGAPRAPAGKHRLGAAGRGTGKAERAAQARWGQDAGSKPSHVLQAAHSPEARRGSAPAPVPGRTGEVNTRSLQHQPPHNPLPAGGLLFPLASVPKPPRLKRLQRFPLTFSSVKCKEVTEDVQKEK